MLTIRVAARLLTAVLSISAYVSAGRAQSPGTINGTIYLDATGQPTHGARITLSPLGRTVDSAETGKYEFRNVPAGTYQIVVHSTGLSDERQRIELADGASPTVDFRLRIAAFRESVTVTATGREESSLELVQSVASLGFARRSAAE